MIIRSLLVVSCLFNSNQLIADQPSKPVIVLSDSGVARRVVDSPSKYAIGILEQSPEESDEAVGKRALEMKHAQFIVFDSSQESPRAALFRQRLTSQGATAVDLRKQQGFRASSYSPFPLLPILEAVQSKQLFVGNAQH
jgi:hypothetical protein